MSYGRGIPSRAGVRAARAADPGLSLPLRRALGTEAAPLPGTVALPYDFHPPRYATEFAPQDAGDVAAGGQVALPGCTLALPAGRAGVIRTLDLFATNTTRATDLRFMLRIDGAGVEGFTPAKLLPVPAAVNARSFNTRIVLPEGARVELVVLNADAGSGYYVGAAFTGWHWPREVSAGVVR